MRYFYTRLMFILIISAFCSISALAKVVYIDGLKYDINPETKEASVGSWNFYNDVDLVIPSSIEVEGVVYSVTGIEEYAFFYSNGLTSVTIPNSVTNIEDNAFSGTRLSSPIIVNDMFVFMPYNYSGHYDIPENVTKIIGGAFSNCSELTSVTIPNSVTSIGDEAFRGCSGLTSITIPNSVTNIGFKVFENCYNLTNPIVVNDMFVYLPHNHSGHYDIPDNITTIVGGAFAESDITSVTIPNSVTSIGEYAFEHCGGLTSVTIPNSVTSIGEGAFLCCSDITSITIPNSVTSIGNYAFMECSFTSVSIPNSVTSIGINAFGGCSELTDPVIVNDMFVYLPHNHSGHYDIPDNITTIVGGAFAESDITSVTIPNSVTNIGDGAFEDCESLVSVTIPNSVTSIGDEAFYGCESLTSVIIPNSLTNIGDNAFRGTGLSSPIIVNDMFVYMSEDYSGHYDIPENVTRIIGGAFSSCSELTSVTIPNSVTSIGDEAFYGCGLISITIPKSVTSIGYWAFQCFSLKSVTCENPIAIDGEFFDDYIPLIATLYVPEESLDSYKITYPWCYFGTILPLSSSGLENLTVDDKAQTVDAIYNLDGNRYYGSKRGVNIIRMKDGKTKKVLR